MITRTVEDEKFGVIACFSSMSETEATMADPTGSEGLDLRFCLHFPP